MSEHPVGNRASHTGSDDLAELLRLARIAVSDRNYELAASFQERALTFDANNADLWSDHGAVLRALGRPSAAISCYDRAIGLRPQLVSAHSNRGNALLDLRRFEESIDSFDRALAIDSAHPESLCARGHARVEIRAYAAALVDFEAAIAIRPNYANAYLGRGNARLALRQWDSAIASFDSAIRIRAGFAEAHCSRGVALLRAGRSDEAIASFNNALALRPDYAEALSNRGAAERELGQLEASVASCEAALRTRPDYAEAHGHLGTTLLAQGRVDAAIAAYDKAIAYRPELVEPYWNKALALLTLGDFERAWPLFEWRWKLRTALRKRNFGKPEWTGDASLTGRTILLYCEQGYGDSIQFSRFATTVARKGARVILKAPRELIPGLHGLEGITQRMTVGDEWPSFDFHCSLLSLPLALGITLSTIPRAHSYLTSLPAKTSYWGEVLGPRTMPRVGLAWSGRSAHANNRNRSIPLSTFLAALPGDCDYVSVQKEVNEEDATSLQANPHIRHFGNRLRDFGDTAALCELMDLIVCVDTSVAHLAGALGKETWVLLPANADWRWLLNRTDSPWYPTMRLYRQATLGDWQTILSRVAVDLDHRLAR